MRRRLVTSRVANIDDCDLVFGRQRDVGLLIARERNSDRLIEGGGLRFRVKLLDGRHDMQVG